MILATILASHAIYSKNFENDEQLKESGVSAIKSFQKG